MTSIVGGIFIINFNFHSKYIILLDFKFIRMKVYIFQKIVSYFTGISILTNKRSTYLIEIDKYILIRNIVTCETMFIRKVLNKISSLLRVILLNLFIYSIKYNKLIINTFFKLLRIRGPAIFCLWGYLPQYFVSL